MLKRYIIGILIIATLFEFLYIYLFIQPPRFAISEVSPETKEIIYDKVRYSWFCHCFFCTPGFPELSDIPFLGNFCSKGSLRTILYPEWVWANNGSIIKEFLNRPW